MDNKVINVGSGKNMSLINEWDTVGITIVGVNNVWRGTDKWNHLIHAGDYPFVDEIPVTEGKKVHTHNSEMGYRDSYAGQAGMAWNTARIHLGLPMYFGAAHWSLWYLKPKYLAFIGFDMNYTPSEDGSTAFYGEGYDIQTRGIPDPLYQMRKIYGNDPDMLNKLFDRLDETKGNTKLFNLSDDPSSVLPWERITFDEFKELE